MPETLTRILAAQGIETPTPIQAATLGDSIAGRDVLGRGRTGSGKTYAFLLPLVIRLNEQSRTAHTKMPRALILAPTRELVGQIMASLVPLAKAYGLKTLTIYGGVGQGPQVSGLRNGVDIVVACPGRLEDLIKQGACRLGEVEITVLDEADHMADLGFLPAVQRLLEQTRRGGQRMLFSATLDNAVAGLVKRFLSNPATHEADSAQSPISTMTHHVLHVARDQRVPVLTDLTSAPGRTIVFTRTKHGAKALARQLNSRGVPTVELHGNLSQGARTRSLDAFQSGAASTMVATDIAARGIHVDDIALVVHADPPVEHKAYLHRSGRTARAGNDGTVITLMTDDQVRDVRSLTRAAGIQPTTTKISSADHPMLRQLAPGDRVLVQGGFGPEKVATEQRYAGDGGRSRNGGGRRSRGPQTERSGGSRGPVSGRGSGDSRPTGARTSGGRSNGGRSAGGRSTGSRPAAGRSTSASASGGTHSAAGFSRRTRSR